MNVSVIINRFTIIQPGIIRVKGYVVAQQNVGSFEIAINTDEFAQDAQHVDLEKLKEIVSEKLQKAYATVQLVQVLEQLDVEWTLDLTAPIADIDMQLGTIAYGTT